jgi:hypothetical protein
MFTAQKISLLPFRRISELLFMVFIFSRLQIIAVSRDKQAFHGSHSSPTLRPYTIYYIIVLLFVGNLVTLLVEKLHCTQRQDDEI